MIQTHDSMMPMRTLFAVMLISIGAGCSEGPQPITGGTAGKLSTDGRPLSQMQVNVFAEIGDSFRPIGRGNVANDGHFQLITADGQEPLELSSGKYRFTLESLGAEAQIPKTYTSAESTPWKLEVSGGEEILLDIPGLSDAM